MEIPGLKLVRDVPKPYPEVSQTAGLYVLGENAEMPARVELVLLDTTYRNGMHAFYIHVIPTTEDESVSETALDFANIALKQLELPSLEEIEPSGGLSHEFGLMQIGAYCEIEGTVAITEAEYEDYYERALRSQYVQEVESDKSFVAFVLGPGLNFVERRMQKIFLRDYPWKDGEELEMPLSPIVNQVFNFCGMMSDEPDGVYLFAGATENIDDSALPHPIPNFEDVEGFYVSLIDAELPECVGVNVSESVRRAGLYELQVVLQACPYPEESEEEAEWASIHADEALERLNLPSCEELAESDEDYPEPLGLNFRRKRGWFILEFEVTREKFEELYVAAARSSFVQLNEKVQMVYILNEKAGVDFEQARRSYLQFYERVREALEPDEAMAAAPPKAGSEVRALVDIDQNLIGFCEPSQNGFMAAEYAEWPEAGDETDVTPQVDNAGGEAGADDTGGKAETDN